MSETLLLGAGLSAAGVRGTAIELAYLISAALFIFSLAWMSDPKTARRGVYAGVAGMTGAVLATWAKEDVTRHLWIIFPIAAAVGPGIWLAKVPLTAVPQRTALSHAFGGLAASYFGNMSLPGAVPIVGAASLLIAAAAIASLMPAARASRVDVLQALRSE